MLFLLEKFEVNCPRPDNHYLETQENDSAAYGTSGP